MTIHFHSIKNGAMVRTSADSRVGRHTGMRIHNTRFGYRIFYPGPIVPGSMTADKPYGVQETYKDNNGKVWPQTYYNLGLDFEKAAVAEYVKWLNTAKTDEKEQLEGIDTESQSQS